MKIAIGGDHAGYSLKQHLAELLRKAGHEVSDLGAFSVAPSDYPDFAKAVGEAVQRGDAERGLVICGSGIGACVAANKLKGIRAALASDTYSARQGVEHDDINVLCLGSRVVGVALAEEVVRSFLTAKFSGDARHVRRLNKVKALESGEG